MVAKVANRIEEGAIALLLVGMTLLVFVEVVLRFGFNESIHWAEEMTLLLAGWFVLYGASYGVKVGAHIGVDAVVRLLSPSTRRIVSIIAVILCLIYCTLFIIGSWEYLAKVYKIGISIEDTRIPGFLLAPFSDDVLWDVLRIDSEDPILPQWLAHSILLIGYILLAFRFVELGWKIIKGEVEGFHFADEAEEALEELHIHDEVEQRKAASLTKEGEEK